MAIFDTQNPLEALSFGMPQAMSVPQPGMVGTGLFGSMGGMMGGSSATQGAGGMFGNGIGQLGLNMPTAQLALSGLGTIGNLWAAFQAQKLAKQQFKFTKDITNTNVNNQIQSYNTQLEDRSRNRTIVEGKDYSSWYDKNKLTRSGTTGT